MVLDSTAWALQRALVERVEQVWREPDEGIWEVRSERRHFTHSKVMAWVAIDRAVRAVEEADLDGLLDRWRAFRVEMNAEICERAFDTDRGCFVRAYGSTELDGSLLLLLLVDFLPPDDERIARTIDAVASELCEEGLVRHYLTGDDGLPTASRRPRRWRGAFLACSFWLVDALVLAWRREEAEAPFDRLVGLCNDVGLARREVRHRRSLACRQLPPGVLPCRARELGIQPCRDSTTNGTMTTMRFVLPGGERAPRIDVAQMRALDRFMIEDFHIELA